MTPERPDAAAPRVSVVLPCYNRARLVGPALQSVFEQTCGDWELIVVDDGSGDDLAAALARWRGDARLRVLRHARNRGVSAARNTGIDAARGRYVAFLDSDDRWLPRKLELQLAAAERQPDPDAVLSITRTRILMPGGWTRVRPIRGPRRGGSLARYLFADGGFAQCSSFFVGTALARRVRFREGLRKYEDHLFLVEAEAAGGRFTMVDEVATVWRNDDRPDRGSAIESVAVARQALAAAAEVIRERPVLRAFEARATCELLWCTAPRTALRLWWSALASGGLQAAQALVLLVRMTAPAGLYQRLRRLATAARTP